MPSADFSDFSLFYEIQGAGNPALIFVHGGLCSHLDWVHQAASLRDAFTVVAFDQRCQGASTGDLDSCSVEQFASDVHDLIDRLGLGPSIIVGHSLGARVTIQAAAQRPENALGIVLVDGSRMTSGAEEDVKRKLAQYFGDDPKMYMAALIDSMFFENADPALKARMVETMSAASRQVVEATTGAAVMFDALGLEPALAAIPKTVPALAIQSTFVDQTTKRYSLGPETRTTPWLDLLRSYLPHLQVIITPGLGHFNMLEAPEQVTGAIRSFADRLLVN
jgi:pimeloyl-ACP methyl ester carboxylesterase